MNISNRYFLLFVGFLVLVSVFFNFFIVGGWDSSDHVKTEQGAVQLSPLIVEPQKVKSFNTAQFDELDEISDVNIEKVVFEEKTGVDRRRSLPREKVDRRYVHPSVVLVN